MAVYTFPGGIKLPEDKKGKNRKIRALPMPKRLVFSLDAWGGRICRPLVKPGSAVLVGQMIAEDESGSYLLHSPVSGRVRGILSASAERAPAILLENDFANKRSPARKPFEKSLLHTSPEELLSVIREAGIPLFTEGGASLYDRLTVLLGNAKTVLVNSIRREPWITGGSRLLFENPGAVIGGLKILLKLLSVRSAIFALEEHGKEAETALEEIAFDRSLLKFVYLKSKYPGWQEKPFVYAATGKALPKGKRPEECGILTVDPETLAAVYQAFVNGMPVTRRILTLDGDGVVTPGNYFVPIGMSLLSIADFLKTDEGISPAVLGDYTAVCGGKMNGVCGVLKNLFVSKEIAAVYLQKEVSVSPEGDCIRCGRCVEVCPAGLPPVIVYRFLKEKKESEAIRCNGRECIGCGCCSEICPGGVRLYQTIFRWKKDPAAFWEDSRDPKKDEADADTPDDADAAEAGDAEESRTESERAPEGRETEDPSGENSSGEVSTVEDSSENPTEEEHSLEKNEDGEP